MKLTGILRRLFSTLYKTKLPLKRAKMSDENTKNNFLPVFESDPTVGSSTNPEDKALVDRLQRQLTKRIQKSARDAAKKRYGERSGFERRQYEKYKNGFDNLDILIEVSIEAGRAFQGAFLKVETLRTDVKVGVIIRLHAKAIRISSEIYSLLRSGYPDGALVRWRTLLETLVTMVALSELDDSAANDFVLRGRIESIKGMLLYQRSADQMNRQKYDDDDLEKYSSYLEDLLSRRPDLKQTLSWTRGRFKSTNWHDFIQKAGFGRWLHDYKLASQDLHSSHHREDNQLRAVPVAERSTMLSGPSDTGLVEPASMAAITLSSITATFISLSEKENFKEVKFETWPWLLLLNEYCEKVGSEFLAGHESLLRQNT